MEKVFPCIEKLFDSFFHPQWHSLCSLLLLCSFFVMFSGEKYNIQHYALCFSLMKTPTLSFFMLFKWLFMIFFMLIKIFHSIFPRLRPSYVNVNCCTCFHHIFDHQHLTYVLSYGFNCFFFFFLLPREKL